MGYGSRALQLLQMYYEGKFPTMDESTHSNHSEITSVSSEVMQLEGISLSHEVFWEIEFKRWGRLIFALSSSLVQAVSLLEEVVTPRKELPPLLLKLSERRAERLHYLGVSYGLTAQLLK